MNRTVSVRPSSLDTAYAHGRLRIERGNGSWWLADDGDPGRAYVERNGRLLPIRGRAPLLDGDVVRFVSASTRAPRSAVVEFPVAAADRTRLEYDPIEGRLYCIADAVRTELIKLRPQHRRLVAHMTERNAVAGCSAALCTYEELRQAIWGEEDGQVPHTEQEINRLVWELRRAVGALSNQASPFETVRGFGYRLHTPPSCNRRNG